MTVLLGFIGAALLIAGAILLESKNKRSKIDKAFAERESLTDEEFFEKYFSSRGVPKSVAKGVRRILAEQLGEDMARVSSSDNFTENLKFLFDSDSLVDVAIVQALEKEFHIKVSNTEAMAMHTVEDIVLGVASKLEQRGD